jgi:ribonuclease P protein component
MVVRFVPNGRDHDRIGISTGRRLGGAVVRNTVRRRIREIVRRCDALLRAPGEPASGRDILIVARPASAQASFADLQASLLSLLRAIPVTPAEIAR